MKKRIATSVLWFLAAWSMAAMGAFALDLPAMLAPVVATAALGALSADLWSPGVTRWLERRQIRIGSRA